MSTRLCMHHSNYGMFVYNISHLSCNACIIVGVISTELTFLLHLLIWRIRREITSLGLLRGVVINDNDFGWIIFGMQHINNIPKFLEYVETTILGPMKEKVVRFWVNKVMHMGNTTTNRVESAHTRLKKYMTSSMCNLCTNWSSVHNMLESQNTQIHASFQTNMIMLEHMFKGKLLCSRHFALSRKWGWVWYT